MKTLGACLLAFLTHGMQPHEDARLAPLNRFDPTYELSDEKDVVGVRIQAKEFSDADFARLSALATVQTLSVEGTKITDDAMASIVQLREIRHLVLKNNQGLKGHGFVHLKAQKKLQALVLAGCPISNEGLECISVLDSLESLNLTGTKVTDDGLKSLGKLKRLDALWLSKTSVTSKGVAGIVPLGNLKSLVLADTAIDDECVGAIIGRAKGIQLLNLSRTNVTDACVPALMRANGLVALNIRRTKITEAGYAALKGQFPKAFIDFGDD